MNNEQIRRPAVAGTFYPDDKKNLQKFIEHAIETASSHQLETSIGIAPHAGYIYSGFCAAHTFKALSKRIENQETTVIIICPNHTGIGYELSLSSIPWQTPLGIINPDRELISQLQKNKRITLDESAHLYEHSAEVMIPFIQYLNPDAKITCICMGSQSLQTCRELFNALSSLETKNVLFLASSDFTHYESALRAEKHDREAIEKILKLDAEGFHSLVEKKSLTICGYGPITVVTLLAKKTPNPEPKLHMYTNSGYTTKDFENVVAYASITL